MALVADVSGGASAVGGVLVARLLPTLASPLVGLLADRLDRWVVLVASDLARAALVFGLIFARDVPAIYALVFLMGADRTVSNPTVRSAFPSVVGRGRPDQGQRRHQRHVQLLGDGRPSAGCSWPLSGWSWPSCSTP